MPNPITSEIFISASSPVLFDEIFFSVLTTMPFQRTSGGEVWWRVLVDEQFCKLAGYSHEYRIDSAQIDYRSIGRVTPLEV